MNVSAKIIVEEVGSVLALPVEAVERGNTVLVAKEGCLDENGVIKDLSAAEERQVTLGRNDESTSRSWTAGGGRSGAGAEPQAPAHECDGDGLSHGTPH